MAEPNTTVPKEPAETAKPEATRDGIHYTPPIDIYELPEEVVLVCDLPGVKPEDLDVQFEKGELRLYCKVRARPKPASYLLNEYEVGDFCRSFTIVPDVDATRIAAQYANGVLTIHLPKQESLKPRKIAVKVEGGQP